MILEEKKVKIIEPTKKLFDLFNDIKKKLLEVFPSSNVSLIGSLAVPMKGKEEIDILLETDNVEEAQNLLVNKGFSKGPIIDGEGFCENNNYDVVIDLHIVSFGHKRIEVYQRTITKIQDNQELREKYENFKESFNGSSAEKYKKEKNKFLAENDLV
jgi:GrpB-like predicted nucleotidyltransferase (UPF0157 family)